MKKTQRKLNKESAFKALIISFTLINFSFLIGITINDILGLDTYNVLKYSGTIIFFMQIFNMFVILKLFKSFKKNVDKILMGGLVVLMLISTFFIPVNRFNYNNENRVYYSYNNMYGMIIGSK